jgi:hypothetical protein
MPKKKPCCKCHAKPRYKTYEYCKACLDKIAEERRAKRREYTRRFREAHPDYVKKYTSERYWERRPPTQKFHLTIDVKIQVWEYEGWRYSITPSTGPALVVEGPFPTKVAAWHAAKAEWKKLKEKYAA